MNQHLPHTHNWAFIRPCKRTPSETSFDHADPAPEHLARAICLAGGSDEAITTDLRYRCSACARLRAQGPAAPHALHPSAREFGDLVALDTSTLMGCAGKLFLNVVDVASRFGLKLRARHP